MNTGFICDKFEYLVVGAGAPPDIEGVQLLASLEDMRKRVEVDCHLQPPQIQNLQVGTIVGNHLNSFGCDP